MRWLLPIAVVALAGCASQPEFEAPPAEPPSTIVPVGSVSLQRVAPRVDAPELVVEVFDRGLDGQGSGSAFGELRKAESILLPVKLAATLVDSGSWASVRVVESPDVAVPVRVSGKILRANGSALELAITAVAADGQLLLEKIYRDEALDSDYPVTSGGEPFADIYRAISNDLTVAAQKLDGRQRRQLARIALIDFAARLAPQTFAAYVETDENGVRQLVSFPAEGDPMLARLQRLRRQDYLFIDTVDEQYRDLAVRIGESYDLWRQYSRELQLYGASYQSTAGDRPRAGRRGSFAAMQQVYGSFRKVKLTEEDLQDLVAGFAGESLETVMEVDDGVVRLRGSVTDRYAEWRGILGRIYALESGAPQSP